jgi:hypothetical protein
MVLIRVFAQEYARDDRVTMLSPGIHQLVVPALKEGRLLAVAVVGGWTER